METEQPIRVINIHPEYAGRGGVGEGGGRRACMHSNVAHILRKDLLIELERAYLAKAYIYYLSLRHQKGDFVMTFFLIHMQR